MTIGIGVMENAGKNGLEISFGNQVSYDTKVNLVN